ncbi:uncharacterized protein LOC134565435 [Prinia subflava]|uniref:uncharacterized protein LOC134565435 n=1 Tax=Prinia subflava TaxID=208062 RepID=UPI002FDFD001
MGSNISRSVEIQISNKTLNIVLRNPRTFFFNGHSVRPREPSVAPGSSTTCLFKSNTRFWGCKGLLAFEAESFTLAIYFSNPTNHNRFQPKMGLELSLDKVHMGNLKDAYERLVRISRSSSPKEKLTLRSVILKESQQIVQVSAGPVKVTATMSQGWDTVIEVKVEEQGSSTVTLDEDFFSPEMDLELFLDRVQEGGTESVHQRLLGMARGNNFASMVLREYQELAEMSAGPARLMAAALRAWDAVIKRKAKKKKSPGRALEARAESQGRELDAWAWHVQEK